MSWRVCIPSGGSGANPFSCHFLLLMGACIPWFTAPCYPDLCFCCQIAFSDSDTPASLVRTLVIPLGLHRQSMTLSPSQAPCRNHTYRISFALSNNVFVVLGTGMWTSLGAVIQPITACDGSLTLTVQPWPVQPYIASLLFSLFHFPFLSYLPLWACTSQRIFHFDFFSPGSFSEGPR